MAPIDGLRVAGMAGAESADLQTGGQPQEVSDPFMTSFGDDPWLSAIFVPWDSMNF